MFVLLLYFRQSSYMTENKSAHKMKPGEQIRGLVKFLFSVILCNFNYYSRVCAREHHRVDHQ